MSKTESELLAGSRSGEIRNRPPGQLLLRSLFMWLILYALSLSLYNGTYHLTSEVMIKHLQVRPSVWLIELTLPEVPLTYTATTIRSPTLELQILRGCDGIEAWLLLITALLVFPIPWRRRLYGVGYGTVLIFSLNVIRIVSLFHIALVRPDWMNVAHGVIWQGIIVLAAAAFVLGWLSPRPAPVEPAEKAA